MGTALLVEYYNDLPGMGEHGGRASPVARLKALDAFKERVVARYTEGTLQRLLGSPEPMGRRAAVLALNMTGTMRSNKLLGEMLRDDDPEVRQLAVDALWAVWFRADSDANNRSLQRILRLNDRHKALTELNILLERAPRFAEAYNQRAIIHFRIKEYQKSIADCERAVKLNPCHFGALSGMAQSFMKLKKPRAALRAFRSAYLINPNLEGVEETIRALEDVLGEEGRNK